VVGVPDPHEGYVSHTAQALTPPVPAATFAKLPLAEIAVRTDGRTDVMERVRTMIEAATPALDPEVGTTADFDAAQKHNLITLRRMTTVALLLTLLIAGCGLAVSVVGGLVERRRPFILLRLAGARPADLNRLVIAEMTAPLLTVAVVSTALGLGLAALMLHAGHIAWKPPVASYWVSLAGGLLAALLIAASAAIGLLGRLTAPQNARFE
jgi:hypothetical protein